MACFSYFFLLSCPAGNYYGFSSIDYKEQRQLELDAFKKLKIKDSSLSVNLGYYQSHIRSFKSGLYIYLESAAKDSLLTKTVIQSISSSKFGNLVPAYEPNYDSYINLHEADSIYRISFILLPEYKGFHLKKTITDTITVNLFTGESVSYLISQ